ncbi:hypothetical protein PSPO01_08674 [Paraphaeosphaeria sporulosa]
MELTTQTRSKSYINGLMRSIERGDASTPYTEKRQWAENKKFECSFNGKRRHMAFGPWQPPNTAVESEKPLLKMARSTSCPAAPTHPSPQLHPHTLSREPADIGVPILLLSAPPPYEDLSSAAKSRSFNAVDHITATHAASIGPSHARAPRPQAPRRPVLRALGPACLAKQTSHGAAQPTPLAELERTSSVAHTSVKHDIQHVIVTGCEDRRHAQSRGRPPLVPGAMSPLPSGPKFDPEAERREAAERTVKSKPAQASPSQPETAARANMWSVRATGRAPSAGCCAAVRYEYGRTGRRPSQPRPWLRKPIRTSVTYLIVLRTRCDVRGSRRECEYGDEGHARASRKTSVCFTNRRASPSDSEPPRQEEGDPNLKSEGSYELKSEGN